MTPMRYRAVVRISQCKNRAPFFFQFRPYSQSNYQQSRPERSSFGIAFDIDGVILRGRAPVGGSPRALRKLYGHSGTLKVPFVFLTNGGGVPESRRATELTEILGVNIVPSQVVHGHTPFKNLLTRYENELIVALGKGEPALVMSEYGFKKVLSLDEYASHFKNIDPVSQYKMWRTKQTSDCSSQHKESVPRYDVYSDRVSAAFVVSDPVDWGRDIQVLCDILRSGGLPGQENGHQPPLYFAADDLEYQAAFPSERLGMGAFRIALESIFNRIHHYALEYVSFGKPNLFVFKNTEILLAQLQPSHCDNDITTAGDSPSHAFKTLYMIGDNPSVDVKGARQAGHPWFSILTRTGVFKGKDNHAEFPADLVVDTVEEAVDYILSRLIGVPFQIHHYALEYVSFGKPNPFVFKNTEILLAQLQPSHCDNDITTAGDSPSHAFKTLYMIGDNPSVDVKGARQAGHPWFSILTRTGVFKGKDNHAEFPADLVVDTVEEAVDYILKREGPSVGC